MFRMRILQRNPPPCSLPLTPPSKRKSAGEQPAGCTSACLRIVLPVPTRVRGVPIRLGAIADVSVGRGPSEVRRIRSQRAAVVSANLSGRDLTGVSDEIRAELQRLRERIPPR